MIAFIAFTCLLSLSFLIIAGGALAVIGLWLDLKDRLENRRLSRRIGHAVQGGIQRERQPGGMLHPDMWS